MKISKLSTLNLVHGYQKYQKDSRNQNLINLNIQTIQQIQQNQEHQQQWFLKCQEQLQKIQMETHWNQLIRKIQVKDMFHQHLKTHQKIHQSTMFQYHNL